MRLPEISYDQLDAAQKVAYDRIASGARGGVGGPFKALLTSPELCGRVEQLGVFIRYECSVPMRLRELAILCVGQHWKAAVEWHAHAPIAAKQGVPQAVIDAIGQGQTPPFTEDADRIVHDFVRVLLREGGSASFYRGLGASMLGECSAQGRSRVCVMCVWGGEADWVSAV